MTRSKESKGLRDFEGREGEGADGRKKSDLLRHVEGRTFAKRGDLWWDLGADPAKPRRTVAEFSDEYFALLRAQPGIAKFLSLGRVVLVAGAEIVEIVPEPR